VRVSSTVIPGGYIFLIDGNRSRAQTLMCVPFGKERLGQHSSKGLTCVVMRPQLGLAHYGSSYRHCGALHESVAVG
jgi:hypothetical protein